MRFISNRLVNSLKRLHWGSVRHVNKRPYILPIAGLIIGALLVIGVTLAHDKKTLRPSDSHVVFIFDNGAKQTIDTKALTVGELINKLPLKLIDQDVVEPDKDTPIVEDNFRINIYRARPVTVIDNGIKTVTLTAQKSPRVVAQTAGINIYAEDDAAFASGDIKQNILGEKVIIDRATPVGLNLYGTPLTIRTHAKTVAELLKEKQIKMAQGDTLQPDVNTPLTPNTQVFLARFGTKISTVEEEIPAPVQIVPDGTLTLGASAVRQAGSSGKRVVTYQINTTNGQESSRAVLQEVIEQAPVPQIVARGTIVDIAGDKAGIMSAAGISAGDYGYVNFIVSHESGWRPNAANASGAYGLCQALPGSKMATAGGDWATNPITQLRWCNSYAQHFGGWAGAYSFWVSHHYW
jgi:uncharacterized protein YabE (DUF348 family)